MIWNLAFALVTRLGIPESLRKVAAWIAISFAAIALLAGVAGVAVISWNRWLAEHDEAVIEAYKAAQAAKTVQALDVAAEQRATDAFVNAMTERERDDAIAAAEASEAAKPPAERATLPPTTVALNCTRLKRAYTPAELAKIPAYKEKCK